MGHIVCSMMAKLSLLAFSRGQARSLPVGEEVFFPNTFLMHSYIQYTVLQIGTKVLQDITVTVVVYYTSFDLWHSDWIELATHFMDLYLY